MAEKKREYSEYEKRELAFYKPEIARSLEQDGNYKPEWRHLVVKGYLHGSEVTLNAERQVSRAVLPEQENDEWVIRLFCTRTWSDFEPEFRDPVNWAMHAWDKNYTDAMVGSDVKAQIIAGASIEGIANRWSTFPRSIEAFLKLYFDVRRPDIKGQLYTQNRTFLSRIVFPPNNGANRPSTESIWLCAAFLGGQPFLELVQERKTTFSADELALMNEVIHNCLTSQTFIYAFLMRTQDAAPHHLEKHQALMQTDAMVKQLNPDIGDKAGNMLNQFIDMLEHKKLPLPTAGPMKQLVDRVRDGRTVASVSPTSQPTLALPVRRRSIIFVNDGGF